MTPFIDIHVPQDLEPDILAEFGTDALYEGEGSQLAVRGVLVEGVEGEPYSPGRYSYFKLPHSQLDSVVPSKGDRVYIGSASYLVVAVDTVRTALSILTLHAEEAGA